MNALSLDMIRSSLDRQLRRWARDPRIACIVLHGAGERRFAPAAISAACAGAIRLAARSGSCVELGGGVGLMVGASHRVVTETSRVAMPEITIGLFPDVGGSRFLGRLPEGVRVLLDSGSGLQRNV